MPISGQECTTFWEGLLPGLLGASIGKGIGSESAVSLALSGYRLLQRLLWAIGAMETLFSCLCCHAVGLVTKLCNQFPVALQYFLRRVQFLVVACSMRCHLSAGCREDFAG